MKTLTFIALLTLAALAGCAPRSRPGPTMTNSTAATNASDEPPAAASPVRVSAEGLNAAEPAVAASRDGAVYVAWVGHGAGKEADVWLTRVDVAAKGAEGSANRTRVEPARANPNPGEATAWRGDAPSVAVARDGAVYVAWTARAGGGGQTTTLYVSASRDGGRGFDAPVKGYDDLKTGGHGVHSLAVGED